MQHDDEGQSGNVVPFKPAKVPVGTFGMPPDEEAVRAAKASANGRPTKFDPEFCDRVIEYGALGKSRTWIAARLGVVRQTLANWEEAYEEFEHAMELSQTLAQAAWEDIGERGIHLGAANFVASAWARTMASRFPADWADKRKVEIEDGGQRQKKAAGIHEARLRALELLARAMGLDPATIKTPADIFQEVPREEFDIFNDPPPFEDADVVAARNSSSI